MAYFTGQKRSLSVEAAKNTQSLSCKVMGSRLQIQGDESVLLRVTHSNLKSFSADIRFSLEMTIEGVKEKLWKKCGTSVNSMCLQLYDDMGAKISDLSDNSRPLGFYSTQDGYRLHVVDLDPSSVTSGGCLEDTSLVEKYKISEEAYDKRDGTFRKFKENLAHQNSSAHETNISDNYVEELCATIKDSLMMAKHGNAFTEGPTSLVQPITGTNLSLAVVLVGDRCQVEPGEKRGVVMFVGQAETLGSGFWIGVQYDEPVGKHDGRVKGTRYFDSLPLHGAMVRPNKVQVGDYPERDPFEEEEI